jgi:glycosyltransferase involved in cell wall biosynthesis
MDLWKDLFEMRGSCRTVGSLIGNSGKSCRKSSNTSWEKRMACGDHNRQEGGRRCRLVTGSDAESRPLISIITAVFNGAATLEQTIRSVAGQNFKNFEYIVVDGGSTDGTINLLNKYADNIDYWVSEPDKGIYDALNKGIDLARGDWLYFIGADDRLADDSVLQRFFLRPADSELMYGNVYWGEGGDAVAGEFFEEKFYFQNICQQAIFYNKKLFKRIGKFDLRYRLVADWVFNMKAFGLKTTKPIFIDTVIAVFSLDGMSTNVWDKDFLRDRDRLFRGSFGVYAYLRFKISVTFKKIASSPKLIALTHIVRRPK